MKTSPIYSGFASLMLPLALLFSQTAHASGQLPPTVIEDRTLSGIVECHALLKKIFLADLAEADPSPVADGDRTSQTLVLTQGPVAQGDHLVTYDVEHGWQFRTKLPDVKQIRNDYSYDRRHYVCDGGHLTGTSTQGYHLESYEDIPSANEGMAKEQADPR